MGGKKQIGSTLVTVIVSMALIGVVIFAVLTVMRSSSKAASLLSKQTQERVVAFNISNLIENPASCTSTLGSLSLSETPIDIEVKDPAGLTVYKKNYVAGNVKLISLQAHTLAPYSTADVNTVQIDMDLTRASAGPVDVEKTARYTFYKNIAEVGGVRTCDIPYTLECKTEKTTGAVNVKAVCGPFYEAMGCAFSCSGSSDTTRSWLENKSCVYSDTSCTGTLTVQVECCRLIRKL